VPLADYFKRPAAAGRPFMNSRTTELGAELRLAVCGICSDLPPLLNETEARRAVGEVRKDRIPHRERFRVAGEGFKRLRRRAADSLRIRVVLKCRPLQQLEDLVLAQFEGLVVSHRSMMFAPWGAGGQELFLTVCVTG
jgi:hypothetical protein